MEDNKIFVFLSHSHLDYEKVRVVRDLLEEEGFRPLMFFLKCLEKKEYEELTKKLIKEEIDNRHRFILCNSENSMKSDWVQFEVEHIIDTHRAYDVVNLEWPKKKIAEVIKRFKIRSTVFLSYSRKQIDLARAVNMKLIQHDFNTFFDGDDLRIVGESYADIISRNIIKSAEEGYVLAIVDKQFSFESWQFKEIISAQNIGGRIIPVLTESLSDEALSIFRDINWIDVREMSVPDASDYIISSLLRIDSRNNQKV